MPLHKKRAGNYTIDRLKNDRKHSDKTNIESKREKESCKKHGIEPLEKSCKKQNMQNKAKTMLRNRFMIIYYF